MAFKRRLKFDKRIRFQKQMSIMYILLFVVLASLGVGYAYIKSNLNINGTANVTAARWDVHFTNLNVTTGSVTATTAASITDPTTVTFAATLDEPNDFYEFTVDVTNQGTMDAMIDSFSISPTLTTAQEKFLEYTVTYSDGTALVDKQELKTNALETLKLRLSYKENDDKTNYPTTDQTFTINFSVDYVQADETSEEVEHILEPASFSTDSWPTIINAVRTNNTSVYSIGATKQIELEEYGTHTIRIANKTTPSACSTTGYSQTACGFVIEFTDIIDRCIMMPGSTVGGWANSTARTILSTNVYSSLPKGLKKGIINTTVVSGHSQSASDNIITTDKLYFLNIKEVWGISSSYDTASDLTRQLDYYQNNGVTNTSNYALAKKKYNNSVEFWWLRSAYSSDNYKYWVVDSTGRNYATEANGVSEGISPAFRIG